MGMTENLKKGDALLSVAEALGLMLAFGGFIITFAAFILDIADRQNNDKKK